MPKAEEKPKEEAQPVREESTASDAQPARETEPVREASTVREESVKKEPIPQPSIEVVYSQPEQPAPEKVERFKIELPKHDPNLWKHPITSALP